MAKLLWHGQAFDQPACEIWNFRDMQPQDIIAISVGIVAFTIGVVGRRYIIGGLALVIAGEIASRLAYPDRYNDPTWAISAAISAQSQNAAIVAGLFLGWLCFRARLALASRSSAKPVD